MKIERIEIRNFRGIRSLEFEPSERMNIFAGANGAGKSTVLEACRILLSWLVARINNPKGRGINLTNADITKGEGYAKLEITVDGRTWRIVKQRTTQRGVVEEKTDLAATLHVANKILETYETEQECCQLPVIINYGVNRSVTEVPMRLRKRHELLPLDVYHIQLDNAIKFRTFFEWYREREDLENERFRRNPQHFIPDGQLQAIKWAIENVMPGYEEFRVTRNPRAFVLQKNGRQFNFAALSDGEKCYFTLVADIARQLAMCNPDNSRNPLSGYGIVLIDEVDLHLHPQWQAQVLPRLQATFPNIQFFVTTHSPFVITNLDVQRDGQFVVMDNGSLWKPERNTYGQLIPEILQEYFGVRSLRSEEVQLHVDRIWQLLAIHDYQSEEFDKEMVWLKSHLASTDLEFAKINLEIIKLKRHAENQQA